MSQKAKNQKKPLKHNGGSLGPLVYAIPVAIVALVLAYLWQYVWSRQTENLAENLTNEVLEISPNSSIHINEIMSKNKSAIIDDRGNYSDWIELSNTSRETYDISGWTLTDKMNSRLYFTFPEGTALEPGELVVVFASSELRAVSGYSFHAPFKLSASGDSVLLFNADGTIMESVNVPQLGANEVYMVDPNTGEWKISGQYTPGMANTAENYMAFINAGNTVSESPLRINEIMADNITYIPDEDGDYCDWIEIYNNSDEAINLNGYGLSDNDSDRRKWVFPNVTIGPRSYLIVYASGKDRKPTDGQNLHTNFSLNAEGEPVILTNSQGQIVDYVSYENLKADISYSRRSDETFTNQLSASPGQPNTREGAAAVDDQYIAENSIKLYISKVMASPRQPEDNKSSDEWVELYNASDKRIDLTDYGLSNDPTHPRKWQFPSGAYIAPGTYMKVALSSLDKSDVSLQQFHTNFGLNLSGEQELTVCTPDGGIIDRAPLINQRASVAYGRVEGKSGFFFLPGAKAGKAYDGEVYEDWVKEVEFLTEGGLYEAGSTVTVEIIAPAGAVVRYTTDCREPAAGSDLYTGPITVDSTTVVRARAFIDGQIPSFTATQTYFIGVEHTMPVVSLVTAPENLYSEDRGIMIKGPNAYKASPHGSKNRGANFWMDWERAANVEIYDGNDTMLSSQGMGVSLQGAYSRVQRQKAFIVTARNAYGGGNTFGSKLLPNRAYTEYQAFVLRGSGQDGDKTRMRDSLLTTLAEGTGVLYQDTRLVIVYINGEYYGHMNIRERINLHWIAQQSGWTDTSAIDYVKANTDARNGSNDSFADMLEWLKKNGCASSENLARVAEVVDIDNYLSYIAIELYVGNTDTLNVRRYRNAKEGDGKWRWILFDLDWAMYTDTNSFQRWLNPAGMGNGMRTDNTLFVELMKNDGMRDKFLHLLGDLMATNFDKDSLLQKIEDRTEQLLPEMPAHQEKFGYTMDRWDEHLRKFKSYVEERPKKLLTYIREATGMSADEMRVYFGAVMDNLGI